MNNCCLTRCYVKGASRKGKYVILNCETQVKSESGSPVNCAVNVYITDEIYHNSRIQQVGLKPGAYMKFTGKTVVDSDKYAVTISVFVDKARLIEYPTKEPEVYIKLFDILTSRQAPVQYDNNRVQVFGEYKNSSEAPPRTIILTVPQKEAGRVVQNANYNISGMLKLRYMGDRFLPVAECETFVKDIVLDERISIKGLHAQPAKEETANSQP